MPWPDYVGICATLLTPAELVEYFKFREAILHQWSQKIQMPSEPALVGQFLYGADNDVPSEGYLEFLKSLKYNHSEFDISYLLNGIGDRIEQCEGTDTELDYYKVLAEFAKLHRGNLKEVKKRVKICVEAVLEDQFMRPTRIIPPTTGCGFMFMPVQKELIEWRFNGLKNLTYAAKSEQHLQRQIGVSFTKDGDDIYIDWCYLDFPWQYDPDLESKLRNNNPFLPLKSELRRRYEFEQS